jgi:LuxR family transcriptional regulator, regulator of acetate metabolism
MSDRSFVVASGHLRASLAALRRQTDLPLTFGGMVDRSRRLTLTEFAAPIRGPLRGAVLDKGRGLGGRAVVTGRPLAVADYLATGRISHHYDPIIEAENLRAMVASPVVVGRVVRAVMYGAVHAPLPLGDRVIVAVTDAAIDVGQKIAVDDEVNRRVSNAELYARHPLAGTDSSARRWEEVREAFAAMRVLAAAVSDPRLRARIDRISDGLAAAAGDQTQPVRVRVRLSRREVDVLACVAMGLTNIEMANDLNLRPETVKGYLRTAMRKLDTHSRLEAVVAARRAGVLP